MTSSSERARLRREILDDLAPLLVEHLAAEHWGRLLVSVAPDARGEPAVGDVEVEGIHGDDAEVDRAFSAETMRAVLPMLAKATEALCALEEVELHAVEGGTFLRQPTGELEWLPGLLRMPSLALARAWDEVTRRVRARRRELEASYGLSGCEVEVDLGREHVAWRKDGVLRATARATLLGTLARASRAWGWGGASPLVPGAIRRASAAVVDAVPERDLWELTTPAFPLDEATARALAAFVSDRVGADGVHEIDDPEGRIFLVLRDVRGPDPAR